MAINEETKEAVQADLAACNRQLFKGWDLAAAAKLKADQEAEVDVSTSSATASTKKTSGKT